MPEFLFVMFANIYVSNSKFVLFFFRFNKVLREEIVQILTNWIGCQPAIKKYSYSYYL